MNKMRQGAVFVLTELLSCLMPDRELNPTAFPQCREGVAGMTHGFPARLAINKASACQGAAAAHSFITEKSDNVWTLVTALQMLLAKPTFIWRAERTIRAAT